MTTESDQRVMRCCICSQEVPTRAATSEEVVLHCVPSCKDFQDRERRVLLHWVTLCPVHGRYMEQHGGWKYIGGGGPHVPFVKDRDR